MCKEVNRGACVYLFVRVCIRSDERVSAGIGARFKSLHFNNKNTFNPWIFSDCDAFAISKDVDGIPVSSCSSICSERASGCFDLR